jgi:hypothetical protein
MAFLYLSFCLWITGFSKVSLALYWSRFDLIFFIIGFRVYCANLNYFFDYKFPLFS